MSLTACMCQFFYFENYRYTVQCTLSGITVGRVVYGYFRHVDNEGCMYLLSDEQKIKLICCFNAMNSVHFCSVTFRSNQMHYFYYLKLKTIYNISL
jgi:hypothetical protein